VLHKLGLDKEILRRIISVKNHNGETVLHTAAENSDCDDLLLELLKFITENYGIHEGKTYYLTMLELVYQWIGLANQ
jgi:hypothetical protein